MKISVVVTTWNAEATIAKCLTSVSWADEIIVVDSSSTDKTPHIAKRFTKSMFTRPNDPMLNVNKNFGFAKATGDWILSLDADEEIPPALAHEIKEKIAKKEASGYWITRKNILFGKWITHAIWWPDPQLRLFRRGRGTFPEKHVHEHLEVEGKTETLAEPMVHYNYTTISQFINKMDALYTPSEVARLQESGYRVVWYDAIRFPVSDFVKLYFAQGGYKDGLHGLVLAGLQAMYALVVFAKLWEAEQFVEQDPTLGAVARELRAAGKDVAYWIVTAKIAKEKNPLVVLFLKIQRRLTRMA
jgi:glycosyltransferase involved in cell wall biosynthesis